jgi:TolA-binding protein
MSLSVDQALSRAEKLAIRGEYERARRIYEEVIENFPGNHQAINGLAEL